jgi:flagellar biosynthetic protein FlhB
VADSSTEQRTEQPTPKRLRDARERGQVPRSRELSTVMVVGVAVMFMSYAGAQIAGGAATLMHQALQIDPALLGDPRALPILMGRRLVQGLTLVAPIFGGTILAALAAPWLLGGWNFSPKAAIPDFSRINPLTGLGRIFSRQGLFELAKSLGKFVLIGAVAVAFLWRHRTELTGLGTEAPQAAIGHLGHLIASTVMWMAVALAIIAAIDAPYQRWNYMRQLKMTRQEIRDEYKQSEGRPEVKARIRRLQHEMSQRRMMEKVPTADVVVTNPTHYAVALKYTMGKMRAPVVVAKGAGVIAATIRELAQKNRVPLVSAPPLARALYRSVDLDGEIPAQLYAAVAQVLTYVYQLRNWNGGPSPELPKIGDVPGGEPDREA